MEEKLRKKFELNGDDSSDDEGTQQYADNYNLSSKIEEEDEADLPSFITKVPNYHYSYISQALGVQILHSNKVHKLYYEHLKSSLPATTINASEENLHQWLYATINNTITRAFKIDLQPSLSKSLTESFLNISDVKQLIGSITDNILNNKTLLFSQIRHDEPLPYFRDVLTELSAAMDDYISDAKITDLTLPPMFRVKDLIAISGIKDHTFNDYEDEIQFLTDNKLIDTDGKTLTTSETATNSMTKCVGKAMVVLNAKKDKKEITEAEFYYLKKVLEIANKGRKEDPINKFSRHQADLLEAKLTFLLNCETQRTPSILEKKITSTGRKHPTQEVKFRLKTAFYKNNALATIFNLGGRKFKKYLPYTSKRFKNEIINCISTDFNEIFLNELTTLYKEKHIQLERGLPLQQQTLIIKSDQTYKAPHYLLASLRFNNRIQKRRARQAQQEQGEKLIEETFHLTWQHPTGFQALESQSIDTKGGRSDLIDNLSNYENIANKIDDFITKINNYNEKNKVGAKIFAKWVRQVLQGNELKILLNVQNDPITISDGLKKSLIKFLTNLTQLLFGTESMRNPSSLILQQMMLDLIIAGKLTWKNALANPNFKDSFGGGSMPMSMGKYAENSTKKKAEPVKSARYLQSAYHSFFLVPYKYPGEAQRESSNGEEKIKELIKRECELVTEWLNQYYPKNKDNSAEVVVPLIEENFAKWYGIDFELNLASQFASTPK